MITYKTKQDCSCVCSLRISVSFALHTHPKVNIHDILDRNVTENYDFHRFLFL